jgi:hypothetical protein
MDIDVKLNEPANYASTEELERAFSEFVASAKLPQPTVIVQSGGGGKHIYWTLAQFISPSEFRLLAGSLARAGQQFDLKFDSQVTVDICRLLRIPGTFNWKPLPNGEAVAGGKPIRPKPVVLQHDTGENIPVEIMRQALLPYQEILQARARGSQDQSEDTEREGAHLRNIDQVALVCPFIRDTLAVGGEGYGEPLWKLTISLAAGCVDPVQTAHRLSGGHVKYTEAETDEKLFEARQAREANPKLAFIRCATLQTAGAKQCASCPHLELQKSPLTVPGAFTPPGDLVPDVIDPVTGKHQPIPGGFYTDCDENLTRLKERFCVVYRGNGAEVVLYENMGDVWVERKLKDLQLLLANAFVRETRTVKKSRQRALLPMYGYVLHNVGRGDPLHAVFKPNLPRFPAPGEFNSWQKWGVTPRKDYKDADGRAKLQLKLILNFIKETQCSNIGKDFVYFIKLHAWGIQNLAEPSHIIHVAKHEMKGTGKTLWTNLFAKIIGKEHAHVFTHEEHLFGKHSVFEDLCYAAIDDYDPKKDTNQGVIRALTTAATRVVEPKGREHRVVTNRLKFAITTHHSNPLGAGIGERRQFVPKIDPTHAQERVYFDRLLAAIDDGGAEMLLGFFLSYDLKGWKPHELDKTEELAKMQLEGLTHVHKWLWDSAEAGYLLGCYVKEVSVYKKDEMGNHLRNEEGDLILQRMTFEAASEREIFAADTFHCHQARLNCLVSISLLRDSFFKHTGLPRGRFSDRAISIEIKKVVGKRTKCRGEAICRKDDIWAYFMPDAKTLKQKILGANHIKNYREDEDDETDEAEDAKGGPEVEHGGLTIDSEVSSSLDKLDSELQKYTSTRYNGSIGPDRQEEERRMISPKWLK